MGHKQTPERRQALTRDAQLNVYNVAAMRRLRPGPFEALRFDPNNDCNVQCAYCHNHRSAAIVERVDFLGFLRENVTRVNTFQMGCVMEPTLDPRMCDLLLDVAASPAKPRRRLVIQTNGILLHMHDAAKIRDAQVTHLSVSIDSADPTVTKSLRGGTSLSKVARNLEHLLPACPRLQAHFITTVTSLNASGMEALVRFGLGLGVKHFVMREVFYHPESDVVDHTRMPSLMLADGEFDRIAAGLRAVLTGTAATFEFAGRNTLEQFEDQTLVDSLRAGSA
jgi:MoaA/NifB/PqqE/SkfB family radical SAM enzyme